MTLCALCAIPLTEDLGLCPHHHCSQDQDHWAEGNRIMCDFVHRGRIPPPPASRACVEDLVPQAIEVA